MPGINTTAVLLGLALFIGLVIIFIGTGVIMHSRKARMGDNGRVGGNIGIGMLIVAFGVICLTGGMAAIYLFRDVITTFSTFK